MSIAQEMAAERIHIDYLCGDASLPPQEQTPFTVNGEVIDPLDAMMTVLEAVEDPMALAETGFAEVAELPDPRAQIVAYHLILAEAKGVPPSELKELSPDLTPEQRVKRVLELIEFKQGNNAIDEFEGMAEKPAPEFTDIFLGDNILPAKDGDAESVSRLRHTTRLVLEVQGFPEDLIDMAVVKVSEVTTNIKQQYPAGGGRIWIGRTSEDFLIVAEGEPLPPNVVSLFHKKAADAELAAAVGKRDVAEHGRGAKVMRGENGQFGKFTIARDENGKPAAYQTWCTTPLPKEFHDPHKG